jgi:hypothetical protein
MGLMLILVSSGLISRSKLQALPGCLGTISSVPAKLSMASLRQIFTCSPLAHSEHYLPNCIVIEDSTLGIQAAVSAGIKTVGFAGASHATVELAQRLKMAGADIVIAAMSDLPGAVERLRAAR